MYLIKKALKVKIGEGILKTEFFTSIKMVIRLVCLRATEKKKKHVSQNGPSGLVDKHLPFITS